MHHVQPVAGARIVRLSLRRAEGGAQRKPADASHAIDTHSHCQPPVNVSIIIEI
jgi:hypothetical protein